MSFMEIAEVVSKKSKDPSTKVGAVIVDDCDRIVSTGYNGFVARNDESYMTFEKPMKYHITIHAEMNALLFAKRDLNYTTIYITHSPCSECLKHILQTRIRKVYYLNLYNKHTNEQKEAIKLLIYSTNAKVINITKEIDYLTDISINDNNNDNNNDKINHNVSENSNKKLNVLNYGIVTYLLLVIISYLLCLPFL